ncbi:MAG: hypothetical protein CMN03_09570 [Roseibacillus sp.]|nr:hypothetical protein [Roseibacillus sp.]
MSKSTLIRSIRSMLEDQLAVMQVAADEARENATGDETRSEGKYDTRAIEASYLASAQAEQVASLSQSIDMLSRFDPPAFAGEDPIAPGALVEADCDGEITYYLLAPAGGGSTVGHEGFDCTVLAPESPLYQHLLGSHRGDLLEDPSLMVLGVS